MENSPRLRRLAATVGLSIAFVVAAVLVSAVVVVRGRLLDDDTYTAALVDADAYERVYTEVFADPELAELQDNLLGRLGLGDTSSTQVRALGTNVLRWTLPPQTLRAGTESVIAGVLAYVRGDSARVDADVAIDSILDRIPSTAVTEVRTLLAAAADRSVASIGEYRVAVVELADQLAAGTVPSSIPVIGGTTFDPLELVDAILDALGDRVDDDMRRQVTVAVLAGDERDALVTAAAELAADHAADVAAQLRGGTDDDGELDILDAVADRARQPTAQVVAVLDTVRNAAGWLGPLTAVAGSILGAGALVGLLWLHRADWRRGGSIVAAALVAAGLANVGLWALVRGIAAPPLRRATTTGPGSWNLPAGLRSLLADVQGSAADHVFGAVALISVVLVATGLVLAGVAVLGTVVFRVAPRRALAAAAVAAAVVAVATATVTGPIEATTARACNGHAELCGRTYDEVVFAATHNSMSSPDIVPVWPEHDGDLQSQLDAGVRVLLIDSKYWLPADELGDLTAAVQASESQVPAPVVDLVYRTLGSLRDGREGTFLCHIHCAFGSIPFVDAMVTVREFVERNPDEVVTLIIQDAVTPEDTAAVMDESGLDEYLYTHGRDESWPTLGELVDRGERVVVFAEEAGPPPPWYANAFEAMQETPFLFLDPDQLSCAPNRGVVGAPLFLMNHWIQRIAPDRVDSVNINRHDVLVERARQCERERGQLPNFIAVNFYNIGDLMAAVDTLNGLD